MSNEAAVALAELEAGAEGRQVTPAPAEQALRPPESPEAGGEALRAPPGEPALGPPHEEAALRRPEESAEPALRPPTGEPALRSPEESSTRGSPPRRWGRYHLYRNDGSTRRLPWGACPTLRRVQVKLVNFLFAFAPRACIVEGLTAAGITRRTYNRWLLAIPAFAADCQDIRDEHTDRDELELDARIRKGDGAALRMKLRANRPEKYDPHWRRAATPAAPPVHSVALLPLPQHRAPKPRIDLTRTALAHQAARSAAAVAPPAAPPATVPYWQRVRGPAPVLR